ncbi:MAG: hypothetical protein E6G56_09650 [Actinobacteria bacterium]|nr:MAG: hypothetical protein E6G56_09650 [Actinomycetota bacterium]
MAQLIADRSIAIAVARPLGEMYARVGKLRVLGQGVLVGGDRQIESRRVVARETVKAPVIVGKPVDGRAAACVAHPLDRGRIDLIGEQAEERQVRPSFRRRCDQVAAHCWHPVLGGALHEVEADEIVAHPL